MLPGVLCTGLLTLVDDSESTESEVSRKCAGKGNDVRSTTGEFAIMFGFSQCPFAWPFMLIGLDTGGLPLDDDGPSGLPDTSGGAIVLLFRKGDELSKFSPSISLSAGELILCEMFTWLRFGEFIFPAVLILVLGFLSNDSARLSQFIGISSEAFGKSSVMSGSTLDSS